MDELLKEFWSAWKKWDQVRADYGAHYVRTDGGRVIGAKWLVVDRLATRIRALESSPALPAGAHADIPGQMYLVDLPAATLAADGTQREVA